MNSVQMVSSTLLSQGCTLETAPSVGIVGETYIPRTEEGIKKPPAAQVQLRDQPAITSSQ